MIDNNILPIILWILHSEDHELRHIPEITRLDIFEGASNDFHDDGLFSTKIFGLVGSRERDLNYGKIDLKVRILHPKIYRDICALRELYRGILNGTATAVWDAEQGDFVPSIDEGAETGYSFFMRHLPDIKWRRSNSPARNGRIDQIERWKKRLTMKNLVVIPAGLRDVEVDETGRTTKNEINDHYWRVLSAASTITKSGDMESPVYDNVRRTLTNYVLDIYEYLEGIISGKDGFMRDKWASRRVREGTRNVLTAMNTGGTHLDSPNVPPFDSTVVGLYQAATAIAPVVIHWLRTGILEKIVNSTEGAVPLINRKTLKREYVYLNPTDRDAWTSEDGLRDLIFSLSDVSGRLRPVVIDDHYLALVYTGDGVFKVFHDIDEMPENFDRKLVRPITLMEVIYLSGYSKWINYYGDVVRYPVNGDDSTYFSKMYVKTTAVGQIRRELDDFWVPMEGDEYLAVEYPDVNATTFHDSQSPHPSRLKGLNADFDGDTGSLTAAMLDESADEIRRNLSTREAWVRPDGKMRASTVYDTSELVIRNLTSRFNHVKNVAIDKR